MFFVKTSHPPAPARSPAPDAAELAERSLVARIAAGEMEAFEALYRGYRPRLLRFLDRMMRKPSLLDEVLDDTLMVVWHGARRYDGSSRVSTWIFAIAYRKALKALSRHDEPVDDTPLPEQASPDAGPEQRWDQRRLHDALRRALDGLSPPHRAVVDLSYFHGMGYREIAEIVDCPVDTVKTRMFHARRRLRAMLPGELEDWL